MVSIIARVEDKTSGSDRKLDLKMCFLEYSSICFKSLLVILYNTPSSGKISCLSSQGKTKTILLTEIITEYIAGIAFQNF